MTITPGELRARTQPTILLRMTDAVEPASGNRGVAPVVFEEGMVVFAQYVGNGRLLLTPIDPTRGWDAHVVMASALNATAEIIGVDELVAVFGRTPKGEGHRDLPESSDL